MQRWFDQDALSSATAFTFNINNQAQPYNTIILFSQFYFPDRNKNFLFNFVNGDLGAFQAAALIHEYMHVLNNANDPNLIKAWEEQGASFDKSLSPSDQLSKFIGGDCPTK